MNYDLTNPFAKILAGDLTCELIYSDEFCISFRSIEPKAKVHGLVIPRGQYIDFNDFALRAGSIEQVAMNNAIINTVKALGVFDSGYRLIYNCGKHSGQTVFHLHCHILAAEVLSDNLDGNF